MAAEEPAVTTPLGPLVQVPPEEEDEQAKVTTMILEEDSWVQEAVLQEDGPESEPFPHSAGKGSPQEEGAAEGPQGALVRFRELCRRWLRPEVHTKEQMLTVLPREIQAWLREHRPENNEEAVALVEDLTQTFRNSGDIQVPRTWRKRVPKRSNLENSMHRVSLDHTVPGSHLQNKEVLDPRPSSQPDRNHSEQFPWAGRVPAYIAWKTMGLTPAP
ncbi:zinc finger and SCAN domain-containing protein 2 isoform X2 [Peromyscus eremicus]|uniref:zinc finger and SCAN domain-containing protein 2 isoform X2 n=1 Tax=Peromyscus eremicus TaxID=42410 RepID=UPI0027DD6717|nr:zinc finger and SCAN domain-containing protein 2 isoform X2 [Peromyscus eremicus]